jgi:hypothetical protein
MPWGKREAHSLFAALALHAVAFFVIAFWASRHRLPVELASHRAEPRVEPHADEFDVDWAAPDVARAVAPGSPQDAEPARLSTRPAPEAARVRRVPDRASPSTSELVSGQAPDNGPTEPPEATTTPERPIDLGLGADGWQHWLRATQGEAQSAPRGPAAQPMVHLPQASPNGGLREGLEARDRAVGLGSSGPVVSALFNAAHGERAPATGLVRFQVTVLQSGAVEVSLRDATSELDAWRAVAADAATRLRKAPPRVPHGRKGVRLQVELRAENSLPNGLKQKALSNPHLEVSGIKFRSTADAQQKLKELNPVAGENGVSASGSRAISDVPGVFLAQTGKVCGYRVGLSLVGPVLMGGCDLSNLGAKPQRIVHSKVIEEAPF